MQKGINGGKCCFSGRRKQKSNGKRHQCDGYKLEMTLKPNSPGRYFKDGSKHAYVELIHIEGDRALGISYIKSRKTKLFIPLDLEPKVWFLNYHYWEPFNVSQVRPAPKTQFYTTVDRYGRTEIKKRDTKSFS